MDPDTMGAAKSPAREAGRAHLCSFYFPSTAGEAIRQGLCHRAGSDAMARLKKEGLGATEIAKRLKIGRAWVHRVLDAIP